MQKEADKLPMECPFVFVRWVDAVTHDGWDEAEEKTDVDEVWSSGHMLENSRKQVKLASDVSVGDGGCNRVIAIPKRMIEEVRQDSRTGIVLYQRNKRVKRGPTI